MDASNRDVSRAQMKAKNRIERLLLTSGSSGGVVGTVASFARANGRIKPRCEPRTNESKEPHRTTTTHLRVFRRSGWHGRLVCFLLFRDLILHRPLLMVTVNRVLSTESPWGITNDAFVIIKTKPVTEILVFFRVIGQGRAAATCVDLHTISVSSVRSFEILTRAFFGLLFSDNGGGRSAQLVPLTFMRGIRQANGCIKPRCEPRKNESKDPHQTSTYDLPTSKEKTPGTAPSMMEAEEVRTKESFMLFGILDGFLERFYQTKVEVGTLFFTC